MLHCEQADEQANTVTITAPRRYTILHTSDLHLGQASHTRGQIEHQDPCICALLSVVSAFKRWHPDVVLVVGDLFENGRAGESLVIATVARLLASFTVPVVLLPGNHDALNGSSVYERFDIEATASNVHLIQQAGGELLNVLPGLAIWGRPVIVHSPTFRPLQGVPPRPSGSRYVVLAHGQLMDGDDMSFESYPRSSPITIGEIDSTHADYVALGHWHRTQELETSICPAWYSGAPRKAGDPGQVIVVTIDRDGSALVSPKAAHTNRIGCSWFNLTEV